MQTDLFNAPPAESEVEILPADDLQQQDPTSPYYTIFTNDGYRITYNKEIRT
jgi:hypothetical protein